MSKRIPVQFKCKAKERSEIQGDRRGLNPRRLEPQSLSSATKGPTKRAELLALGAWLYGATKSQTKRVNAMRGQDSGALHRKRPEPYWVIKDMFMYLQSIEQMEAPRCATFHVCRGKAWRFKSAEEARALVFEHERIVKIIPRKGKR